jgi:hypothetical protein
MRKSRGAYRILVGKHEENRKLGRPRSTGKDNIKINGKKHGLEKRTLD